MMTKTWRVFKVLDDIQKIEAKLAELESEGYEIFQLLHQTYPMGPSSIAIIATVPK